MSKDTKQSYATQNPDVYGANMPAGANYQNTTYQTDPPNYVNPLEGDPFADPEPPRGKNPHYETDDGVVIEFTPKRRRKMLRNLYTILAVLIIIHVFWITLIAVSVAKAHNDDDY
ncbi:unnamed protein product [Ambrosiozyma monospora]|uniref:Unnamed protein product n=1 Tax=Ambrosiozyma monospora TaxID=43982 RepID=A0ACB5TAN6_AMBMO|nr:unnamed protein product [Ambrosiozyma monospora]